MRLNEEQARSLLLKHGAFVSEACDKCGKMLGPVRFTFVGEVGEWCSRECRDGVAAAERHCITRKGGRPRKYHTERQRKAAIRLQKADWQRNERQRLSVEKNPPASDSFDESTEAENRPLAIPIAGGRL